MRNKSNNNENTDMVLNQERENNNSRASIAPEIYNEESNISISMGTLP